MIRKKWLALILTVTMVIGQSASSVGATVEAEDTTDFIEESVEEEMEEEEQVVEEPVIEESVQVLAEDEGKDRYQDFENITGMDEEGNIYEVSGASGVVELEAVPESYAMAPGNLIVNFNTKGSGVVTNYKEVDTGKSGYVCGPYGADAAYLGTYGDKVRFLLSGVIGEVAASDVQVFDFSKAESVSHYLVTNGRLYHKITGNMNQTSYSNSLDNGQAPSYLKGGEKYLSYDGHYFYHYDQYSNMVADYQNGNRNHSINADTPFYNYFQFLPMRSKSAYTEAELNAMINKRIDTSLGADKGAKSKLRNLGPVFVQMQNTYGTNALLVASIAANESGWGGTNICQTKNNLFGINAVDSSPAVSANTFESPTACVKDFTETYLSKRYLRAGYKYYNCGITGNKAAGMNWMWASDPYWGEKAAAIAWVFNKDNGNKDVNLYSIGIKDTLSNQHTDLNVRKESNASSTKLYSTGTNSNYAFLIWDFGKTENGFYKIQSDAVLNADRSAINAESGKYSFQKMYAYASASYIRQVNTGKEANSGSTGSSGPLQVSTHVQSFGWMESVGSGEIAGTTGLAKRMEAIQIKIEGIQDLGVEYAAHVQSYGWMPFVKDGEMAGTSGEAKRMEAVKIRLTGKAASEYDIFYRAHVQKFGWLGWAKNGEAAGSEGFAYRIEALEVRLIKKGDMTPEDQLDSFRSNKLTYSAHVQKIGWQDWTYEGSTGGTIGKALRLEAIKMKLQNPLYEGDIQYRTYVQKKGWMPYVKNGQLSGTSGQSLRLEAIQIQLTGKMAEHYDVYYRTHIQSYGWLDWTKNGLPSGSEGLAKRMEAIEIQLVEKGQEGPGSSSGISYIK